MSQSRMSSHQPTSAADRFTVAPQHVGRERYPTVTLTLTSDPLKLHMLSPDEATALANLLTDAVDELNGGG